MRSIYCKKSIYSLIICCTIQLIFNYGSTSVDASVYCGEVKNLAYVHDETLGVEFEWNPPTPYRTKLIGYQVWMKTRLRSEFKYGDKSRQTRTDTTIWIDDVSAPQTLYKRDKNFEFFACVNYNFYIKSLCSNGTTEKFGSPTKVSFMLEESEYLWEVNNFNVIQNGKDIILTWSPLRYYEECNQTYKIEVKDEDGDDITSIDVPPKTFEYRISTDDAIELEPCTDYFFTLIVNGRTKILTATSTIRFRTSAKAPGEVSNFHVTSKTNNSITVGWTNPKRAFGCAMGYELDYKDDNGKRHTFPAISVNKNSFTLQPLKYCNSRCKIGITTIGLYYSEEGLYSKRVTVKRLA